MSRKRKAVDADAQDEALDHLRMGGLTWFGLCLAAIGWICLLGEIAGVDILSARVPRLAASSLHADLLDVEMCIIGSGFALAMIGALQSGFGALNRFFEAVLMRSSQRHVPSTVHAEQEPPLSHGRRPYRILADGSVEVETIVGTRRFDSLAEARDFI